MRGDDRPPLPQLRRRRYPHPAEDPARRPEGRDPVITVLSNQADEALRRMREDQARRDAAKAGGSGSGK
ncbi:hypothetical protein GCM10010519_18640 [Streptomyces lactacystinicus]